MMIHTPKTPKEIDDKIHELSLLADNMWINGHTEASLKVRAAISALWWSLGVQKMVFPKALGGL